MTDDQDAGTKVPPPTPATKAYRAAVSQLHKDMAVQYDGDADRDFATILSAHNKGAADLAKIELKHGKDPALRKLAQDIIDARDKESAALRAWQSKHR